MMNKSKDKWIRTAVALLIFTVVLFCLSVYAAVLDRELNEEIWTGLDNVAGQSVYNIQEECRAKMRLLEDMATHLGTHDLSNRDEIQPLLELCAERDAFKRVGFAFADGTTYTTDGTDRNVLERDYYINGINGEIGVSDRLIDYVDQTPTIVFYAPIYDRTKENVLGMIFATYDIQQFQQIIKDSTLRQEYGFLIMNAEGEIMVSDVFSWVETGANNLFSLLEVKDEKALSARMQQILGIVDQEGSYALQDRSQYLHVSRLGLNDWYFVALAPTQEIMRTRNSIMLATYSLCAVVVILSVSLVVYMIYWERRKNRELEKVLYEDPLTGGYSYQRFRVEAMKALAENRRKAAFIIMDIDQFKLINELFGVKSGDDTLKHLNQLWLEWIQPPEVFARRTADCFGALAFYDDKDELLKRVDDFVNRVLEHDSDAKGGYVLRPHLGIYLIQSHDEDFESMQNNAAIVHGMVKGNNSVYYGVFDKKLKERTVQNKILEDQLELAYRSREYLVYYQPKYDAQTGKLCGAEALVRWRKANGELIPPGTFIPLAEKKGMVEKLDRYVFEEVCQQMRVWRAANKQVVPVSVNLSRENLKNEELVEEYVDIRDRNELAVTDLEIELTESTLFENMGIARPVLDKLRSHGFRILMDDFGTGYSSLMMLKKIPVDVVKLDKSFVDDYNDSRGEQIIRCVVGMMNGLHMRVTAEGVETKEQYEFLRDLGCDTIQGYYFAKPMPAEEFAKLLQE